MSRLVAGAVGGLAAMAECHTTVAAVCIGAACRSSDEKKVAAPIKRLFICH